MFKSFHLKSGHYYLLAFFIAIGFYVGLGGYPLSNNNEGLYAEVAREMLLTGNYIIPHLNFVPYIEKPPLLYWLIALSYHVFGVTTWAARLIPASCGALTIVCLLWLGQKIGRAREAWLTAVILATSLGYIVIARIVFFDMLLTACLTVTLSLFYVWWQTDKKYYLRSAYIFLGLGVLSKGLLILVLVFAISVTFLFICRQKKRILSLFDFWGIILFLAIVLPWHVAANIQYPGFFRDYFINEQVLRFLNERIPHDYYQGPIYYYIPRILAYLLPWSLLLPLLCKRHPMKNNDTDKLALFLWLWFIVPLVFFSVSQAKANYYMIIGMPALAYLLAIKINQMNNLKSSLLWSMVSISLITLLAGYIVAKKIPDEYSELSIIQYLQAKNSGRPVYLYDNYAKQSTLLFYLQKRLPMIAADDPDLAYGAQTNEAKGWFISVEQFKSIAEKQFCYVALVKESLSKFYQVLPGLGFCPVTATKKGLLLSNDPGDCNKHG